MYGGGTENEAQVNGQTFQACFTLFFAKLQEL
jgi:hypothetical protein